MSDLFTKQLHILDSATGTRLQALGMPANACTPDWVLRNPEAFLSIRRGDIAAGSDMIYAPTFGASAPDLKKHGISAGVRDMNIRLVELAKEAADGRPVGGNLSPTGLQVFPAGMTSFDALVDIFAEQAAAQEEAGVDFFAIETQMSLAECRAAVTAVRSVSEKPILCSFSVTDASRSLFGEDMTSVLMCLQDMGVSAFGINCCGNLGLISRLLAKLRRYASIPLVAKPNAGTPSLRGGQLHYSLSAAKMAAYVPRFIASGARLLGGCCGTGPEFIAAIRAVTELVEAPEFTPVQTPALAASPYRTVELTPRMKMEELEIDDDIVENAAVAEATGAKLLNVELRDEMDLDTLNEAQIALRLPLAIRCSDGELLRRFLRLYNGKPVVL